MIGLTDMVSQCPEAVFIRKTSLTSFEDTEGFRQGGYDIAGDLFTALDGRPERRTFVLKPNVVNRVSRHPQTGELRSAAGGIVTNPYFVGGIIDRLRELGAARIVIAEGGGEVDMGPVFESRGYGKVARERGVKLVNLNREEGTYREEELNRTEVEGIVFREIPFVRPVNDPDTVFINVPTLKTHNLAILSLCTKNIQGSIIRECRRFCALLSDMLERYPWTARYYQPHYKEAIAEFRQRKLQGAEWKGDYRDDLYAHRACDSVLGLSRSVHIVEGIVGREGTGFHHGRDVLVNLILAGMNPVHVDAVAAYLMGHDPRRIPYLQVAHARGLGRINPEDIQVYLACDGPMERCEDISEIGRVPLGVYHRGDTSKYVFF